MAREPYRRSEFNRALIANALADPFNVVLLAVMLAAGFVIGTPVLMAGVAGVVYLGAAARTYLDEGEANQVLERERGKRRAALESGRAPVVLERLAPEIRRLVEAARVREQRIHSAVSDAELPFDEVAAEVDTFVSAMEATAKRAQLLWDTLADTAPEAVEARLRQVEGDPAKAELTEALRHQLDTLRRMERRLEHFYTEMERVLVELDTVRSQLVSVSAAEQSGKQAELAGEVRGLRERMGAVADGMAEAYAAPEGGERR
jgi:chromosome segregation ATPase